MYQQIFAFLLRVSLRGVAKRMFIKTVGELLFLKVWDAAFLSTRNLRLIRPLLYEALPSIECYAGQLNQAFMNILANAIDAIDEMSVKQKSQQIEVDSSYILLHKIDRANRSW